MSKILKEFREGEVIPENAKFVGSKQKKEYSHTTYDYGIFWTDRTTYYKHYTVWVYEVEENE